MRSEKLGQDSQHELDVVDAVVRGGGHARPEDAALTDFALLVRSARPLPDHGTSERLDKRLAGGSTRAAGASRKRLLAVAASLVLVVGVGGIALNADRIIDGTATVETVSAPQASGGDSPTADYAKPAIEMQDKAKSDLSAAAPPSPPQGNLPAVETSKRDVARTARMTLATEGRKVERVSDRVIETVDAAGGYVASSQVRSARGNRGSATFALMLPSAKFQDALVDLSKLAHVRSRSQSTEDITAQAQSANRMLARARARVKHFETRLASATTDAERASLKARLARAKFVERQELRQVRRNRSRVNYVPLELKIVADNAAVNADRGPIGRAVNRAAGILTGILAFLIVAAAVLLPLVLITAASAFGWRRYKRARRDRTIAGSALQPE